MKESLYNEVINRYGYDNFYYKDILIEQPNGMMRAIKHNYDLILFNSKKIVFFSCLNDSLSETEVVYALRGALNSLVCKLSLSFNDFVVCGADKERCFYLNKYNDRLVSFDIDSNICFEILEYIENEVMFGKVVFDSDQLNSFRDAMTLLPSSNITITKEKTRVDSSGKVFTKVRGVWREASDFDTGTLFPLTALGGMLGAHLFYQKKMLKGLLYFLTLGLFGIGWLFDCFEMLFGIYKDPEGKYLARSTNVLTGPIMILIGAVIFFALVGVVFILAEFVFP